METDRAGLVSVFLRGLSDRLVSSNGKCSDGEECIQSHKGFAKAFLLLISKC